MAEYTVGLVLDVTWTGTMFVVSGRLQVLLSPHGRSSPDSLQILLNIASRLPGVISEKEESPTLESTSLCVAMSVYKCHYPPELVDIAFHSGWIIQYRPPRNRGI